MFLAAAGAIRKIAGTGDTIDPAGALVTIEAPGAGAASGGAITFTAIRADSSRGLYVARPAVAAMAIERVASAASYASTAISPGEIVTVSGSGIGPAALVQGTLDADGLLPKQLAGARVLFDGVPAPLLYVLQAQCGAIVP